MSDARIRENVSKMPVSEVENPAFVTPPKLSEATVAIVTTAGLRKDGDASWTPHDPNFRVFDSDAVDIQLGHLSPNFDRSGFVADINVSYPIDRLKEMAAEGVIGAVAPRHVSFMGAQDGGMGTIRKDTAPAVAKLFKDDGVDVVLLTPV